MMWTGLRVRLPLRREVDTAFEVDEAERLRDVLEEGTVEMLGGMSAPPSLILSFSVIGVSVECFVTVVLFVACRLWLD